MDYGVLSWILSMRLPLTGLSIPLAIEPDFLASDHSPAAAIVRLLALAQQHIEAPIGTRLLVADSLWCNSESFSQFRVCGVWFLVSLRTNNGLIPPSVTSLAQSDLPLHMTRTYSKGPFVVQVSGSTNETVRGLVTDAWEVPGVPPPRDRPITYASALALSKNETVESLVNWQEMDEACRRWPMEKVIFEISGWDITREEDQQEDPGPVTLQRAQAWNKAMVRRFYQRTMGSSAPSKMSKKKNAGHAVPQRRGGERRPAATGSATSAPQALARCGAGNREPQGNGASWAYHSTC